MRAALAIVALMLSGCAGSNVYVRSLEQSGDIRLATAPPGSGADYVVTVRNDNKVTRDQLALTLLQDQCPTGRVVGETSIRTGTALLGPTVIYELSVKCGG
jgi:hypothetical protein